MKTRTYNPVETCQQCGAGIYPGEHVLVVGKGDDARAICARVFCHHAYLRAEGRTGRARLLTRLAPVEVWLNK